MKEMTEVEIIKALECCYEGSCIGCPANKGSASCLNNLVKNALDLIKRKDAEKERLQEQFREDTKKIKSEAYREFAEKLLEGDWYVLSREEVDEVLKEFTEKNDFKE